MGLAQEPVKVLIDGELQTGGFPNNLAIASFEITWGTDDILTPADPSTIELTMYDAYGKLPRDRGLIGRRVDVVRGTTRIFRGHVTDLRFQHITVVHKQRRYKAWQCTVTAVDPMAELDKFIPQGKGDSQFNASERPEAERLAKSIYGENYFGRAHYYGSYTRLLNEIREAGAEKIVPIISGAPGAPIDGSGAYPPQYLALEAGRSALDWLRVIYRAPFGGYPIYDPRVHGIRRAEVWFVPSGNKLTYEDDTLTIAPSLESTGVIPASRVYIEDPVIRSSTPQQITNITVNAADSQLTSREDPETGKRVQLKDTTKQITFHRRVPGSSDKVDNSVEVDLPGAVYVGSEFSQTRVDAIAAEFARVLSVINGKTAPSGTVWDFGTHPTTGDEQADELLLTPTAIIRSIYFPGSMFNGFDTIGPYFSIIGGKLTYTRESGDVDAPLFWRSEFTLGPVDLRGDPVTYSNMVTIPEPEYQDFDPSITYADLGSVTQGAS